MSTAPKILLTGATGFVGGSVLTALLNSPSLKTQQITCLLRSSSAASTLTATYGDRIQTLLYNGLDDTTTATTAAASHDIVIYCTLSHHTPGILALIRGLAQRKATTGQPVWFVHTSGTSNLGDLPVSGKYLHTPPDREFDDARDDVYAFERERDAVVPYFQRTAELAAIDTGMELGVKTVVIMSPTIYGVGTGLFNRASIQVPACVRTALMGGRSVVIGEGAGVWDHVHVEDMAALYQVVVEKIVDKNGEGVPAGRKGILFCANGRHSWKEVAQGVADALVEAGKMEDRTVVSMGLADAAKVSAAVNGMTNEDMIEAGIASNSRTVSTVGRKLGWVPIRGDEFWKKTFHDDVSMVLRKEEQKSA